jgi:hypothetical protein
MADEHSVTHGGEREILKTTKKLQKMMFKSHHIVEINEHPLV